MVESQVLRCACSRNTSDAERLGHIAAGQFSGSGAHDPRCHASAVSPESSPEAPRAPLRF